MRLAINSKRTLALPLAVLAAALMLALLFLLLTPRVARAGGVVTTCDQSNLAAALAGGGFVTFNCGGPATITLASQIVITQNTTMDGGTLGLVTLSGNNVTRLFSTTAGVTLHLLNLTVRDGNAGSDMGGALLVAGPTSLVNTIFISNTADTDGGAVFAAAGAPLTVTDSVFHHNLTLGYGGALVSRGALWVTNSEFYSNTAVGGGALALAAEAAISNSRFYLNVANFGGGLYAYDGGLVQVTGSQFYSNTASSGGGLLAAGLGLWLTDSTLHHNHADAEGGALYAANPTTVSRSEFYSNTADSGGAVVVYGPLTMTASSLHHNLAAFSAGALEVYDASALQAAALPAGLGPQATIPSRALLTQVDIYDNVVASGFGGGVDTRATWVGFDRVRIFNNRVVAGNSLFTGGGLAVFYGTVVLTDSAVYGNVAGTGPGGGIHASFGATLTLVTSAVYSNVATTGSGGGISAQSDGGATRLRIYNSTVSGNSAQLGGGIYLNATNTYAVISYTTLYGNLAPVAANFTGTSELHNSIIAGGGALNCGGSIKSYGYNLDDGDSCGLGDTGDLTSTNPLLGPLGWNGGPTLTHAPLPTSPVIDAAAPLFCPATDQRGGARPVDGNGVVGALCDMGAYEYRAIVAWLYLPLILR